MLSLEDVKVRKGNFLLEVGNLSIEDGETVAVMGVSGSGKTTLLEVLAGLESATEGNVTISGEMSFGYQNPYLQFFTEKVSSEIMFSKPRMSRSEANDIVQNSLSDFHLDRSFMDKSPYELSGGEARRVLLAALSSDRRPYLYLDECLSGLDEKGEATLKELIGKRRKSGLTTIFTSHDPDFSALAERLLVIEDGKLAYDGPARDILSSSRRAAEFGLKPTYYAMIAENIGLAPVLDENELVKAIIERRRKDDAV